MKNSRIERDALGEVELPSKRLYGASTQRSLEHFWIGGERMPLELIRDLIEIKLSAAEVNGTLALLDIEKAKAIVASAKQLLEDLPLEEFPLVIWQTGSGTQTHMNVNEVLANLASERLGGKRGEKSPIHPNDDLNLCQSSNDVFASAIHISCYRELYSQLQPAYLTLRSAFEQLIARYGDQMRVARTHCMDAAPTTFGHLFAGYLRQTELAWKQIEAALEQLKELALGATAVGTGLGSEVRFAPLVIQHLAQRLGFPFCQAFNLPCALSSHEALLGLSGSLRTLATALHKIANDIRLLGSGPRCGLAELKLPANEPGSSIMPGKINPTQCESLTMVAIQVMGLDSAVAMASALGQLELNTYKPLIAHNILRSIRLLSDAMQQFSHHCLEGLEVDRQRVNGFLENSLMLATALNPLIGYDKASKAVHYAHNHQKSLKEAVLFLGLMDEKSFDLAIDPRTMLQPYHAPKSV